MYVGLEFNPIHLCEENKLHNSLEVFVRDNM